MFKRLCKTAAFWAVTVFAFELAFHILVNGALLGRFWLSVPFTLSLAVFLAALTHALPWERANCVVSFLVLGVLILIFGIQTVYFKIFKDLLSLAYVSMGGEAVENYRVATLDGIRRSLGFIVLYLAPVPALAVLLRKGILDCGRVELQPVVMTACASVLVFALGVPSEDGSARAEAYHDPLATVGRQESWFGLLTAERMDLMRLGRDETGDISAVVDLTGSQAVPETRPGESRDPENGSTPAPDSSHTDLAPEPEPERNVLKELDFEKLEAAADNDALRELNAYFSRLAGTAKNEYTGIFEGFNVIELCAESFSPYLIDPELTPTLYRLSTEGFVFNNFYCSFNGTTTNGEYSMCMGLLPDLTRMSFISSTENLVPFTLGNQFVSARLAAYAYHNNIAAFYGRINTHPNMGYTFRAIDFGLDMAHGYPASDLEMMEKTVDEYISEPQFVVHYMTYSGHNPYTPGHNEMGAKNWDRVADLDFSDDTKIYLAANLELEDALTYLIGRLEEAGIADRTLIVLTGDHFPYALSEEEYAALAGEEALADPFWKYKNSFICWTAAMSEPVYVDDYCCTQDILPTISNLLGLPYDSRLMTGTDVLSGSTHIAILQDGSFLTRDLVYDAASGKTTYKTPEKELPAGYAEALLKAVKNQFSVSAAILRNDYYRFAFDTCGISAGHAGHHTNASFKDTAGTWYEADLELLAGAGVVNGSWGYFYGDNPCLRSDFLSMIDRLIYPPAPEENTLPYTDLNESDWFYGPILRLWGVGLLPEGETLGPLEPITPDVAREYLTGAAVYLGIEDAGSWAARVVEDTLTRAAEAGEDTQTLTRGAVTPIIAALMSYLDM